MKPLLLDTHAFLWWLWGDARLWQAAREHITDAPQVYVSSVSIWEVAIKNGIGKIDLDPTIASSEIGANHFKPLPITPDHAAAVARLPRHHADPFDRMLIAQALSDDLILVTRDKAMFVYKDTISILR